MLQAINNPDSSWLNGKYPEINAEINTSLPYVAIDDFFVQGDDAELIISDIHKVWINEGGTIEEAIKSYAANML